MRKNKHRISILLIVVGSICLLSAGFFALAALSRMEYQRGDYFSTALAFAGAGAGSLLIRFLFISLPDSLKDRRSGVANRRRSLAREYRRPDPSGSGRNDGGALIWVLALAAMMTSAALYAITSSRAGSREADRMLAREKVRLAAMDTVQAAMTELADDEDLAIDHPGETWAARREFTDAAGVTRMYRIHDLQSAFDLNNLAVERISTAEDPEEIVANLLLHCGVFSSARMAAALKDWVDTDVSGAYEAGFYDAQDLDARVANRVLFGWNELMQVHGWTPGLLERKPARMDRQLFESDFVDCASVIPVPRSRAVPVNINSANPAVLEAVFGLATENIVSLIVNRREREPFRSIEFLADILGESGYRRVRPYLDVKSRYFEIDAKAYADGESARIYLLAERFEDGRVEAVRALF